MADRLFFEAHVSHPGAVRPVNEDFFLARADEGLWVVADGMGGFKDGRWASRAVVQSLIKTELTGDIDRDARATAEAIQNANFLIFKESTIRRNHIGSTVVALLIAGTRFVALWAGDSRAYLWRRGVLIPLTRDHTQVRQMVDAGYLTPEEAAHHPMGHVLARAVGVQASVEVETAGGDTQVGDLFLLCSDGLSAVVSDAEIAAELSAPTPALMTERLLAASLAAGAPDNVTILAIGRGEVSGGGARAGALSAVVGGAAGEDEAPAAGETQASTSATARRGGAPVAAMIGAAVLVLAVGALVFGLARGHHHAPATASAGAGQNARSAIEARGDQLFEAALGGVDCSSIELQKATAGPSGLEVALAGVAASPAAAQDALGQAAARGKLQVADFDLGAVAPAPPALCPVLDALRPFRAATSLSGQNLTAAQDSFAIMQQADKSLAGRAIFTLTPPAPPSDFAVYQLGATGGMAVVAASRDAFNAMAQAGALVTKLPGTDSYRLQVDYAQPGWSSLVLLSGRGPFPPTLIAPTSRGADWSNQFTAAAKTGGWRAEMAWFRVVQGAPESMVLPTQTAPPVPTLMSGAPGAQSAAASALSGAPAKGVKTSETEPAAAGAAPADSGAPPKGAAPSKTPTPAKSSAPPAPARTDSDEG